MCRLGPSVKQFRLFIICGFGAALAWLEDGDEGPSRVAVPQTRGRALAASKKP